MSKVAMFAIVALALLGLVNLIKGCTEPMLTDDACSELVSRFNDLMEIDKARGSPSAGRVDHAVSELAIYWKFVERGEFSPPTADERARMYEMLEYCLERHR